MKTLPILFLSKQKRMLWPDLLQYSDTGFFFLRLAVGLVFVYHGLMKLKDPKGMAAMMGNPGMAWFPAVLGLVEFLSGLGVILGVYFQLAALFLAVLMVGAIMMKIGKWKVPFSAMDKMGWEFDLVLLAAALAMLLGGGGATFIIL